MSITEDSLRRQNVSRILLSNMLVNTNLALYPIKEAKSYGTGITTSPYELVQTLKSRALKGIAELSASLSEDATLGYQLFQSLFKGDYTFPNKRALRLIENVSHTEGRCIPFMSSYATLEGEGPEIGKPTILSRLGGCAVRCHGCFLATDTIMTSAGLKYLYDVKEGDWLYTFDEDYNLTKTQVTKALHQIVDPDQLVRVYYQERLNNGKLVTKSKICTDDHEWNVKKKGWVEAKDLKKGQIVYHLNNKVIDMPLSSFNTLSKRINKYIHNGVKILKVEYLNNKAKAGLQRQYDNRKTASDYVSIVNFSCAPYNHFLIDGVHVHNCDTPHSWNANTEPFDGNIDPMRNEYNQLMHISDIADLIVQQADCYGLKRISITGGEPLHYIDALRLLVADLWLRGFYINIETSGTLFDPVIFAMCHVSVDIKTPSSKVVLSDSQIGALHAVTSYDHANPAHIKSVISDQDDLAFILDTFSAILNGEGTYRPICLTPWAAATQENLNVGAMSNNVQEITTWIFDNKDRIDARQVRVIGQQHKLFSFA